MFTNGPMEEDLKVVGQKTNFTAGECTPGLMEGAMTENITKTKSMASEFIFGLIKRNMKVTGKMENNMAKASSLTPKENQESVCGRMENASSGYQVQ